MRCSCLFKTIMEMKSSMKWTLLMLGFIFAGSCASGSGLYRERMICQPADSIPKDAVRIAWMGTAGLYVTDGETGFFIDPFVSRSGLLKVLWGHPLASQPQKICDWLNRIGCCHTEAVIVSHSHYDHALDAPFFAQKTGARLIGSDSTAWIGRGAGVAENQIDIVHAGDRINLGKFEILFIESRHSKAVFGRVPWPGAITEPLIPPAAASDYRLGEIFALVVKHPNGSFVHLGSAGYIEGMFDGLEAHTIFLSIAGRENTEDLLQNTALALKAKQIIPIHFDNFFRPLDQEMSVLWGVKLSEFYKTASLVAPDIAILTAPLGRPFILF
jgi:L-ascorbate metabolism protein UlaG (beta-lactamase superfamily)